MIVVLWLVRKYLLLHLTRFSWIFNTGTIILSITYFQRRINCFLVGHERNKIKVEWRKNYDELQDIIRAILSKFTILETFPSWNSSRHARSADLYAGTAALVTVGILIRRRWTIFLQIPRMRYFWKLGEIALSPGRISFFSHSITRCCTTWFPSLSISWKLGKNVVRSFSIERFWRKILSIIVYIIFPNNPSFNL